MKEKFDCPITAWCESDSGCNDCVIKEWWEAWVKQTKPEPSEVKLKEGKEIVEAMDIIKEKPECPKEKCSWYNKADKKEPCIMNCIRRELVKHQRDFYINDEEITKEGV